MTLNLTPEEKSNANTNNKTMEKHKSRKTQTILC